jgi:hypothetical protein
MWGVRGRGGGRLREGEGDVKTNDAYLTVIHSTPLCVRRLSPFHCLNPKPLNPKPFHCHALAPTACHPPTKSPDLATCIQHFDVLFPY